ncbi:hypothetical protein [Neisseria shayeganii]|uniref:Lipoprotein n=1 Tax=Neisseria shayeganii TaxID=607712 RepID=A0A7D7SHU5_9NEIS|nr:hypothetical protein [Neisseria shayeganii]QMT41132.1 hypothetical protein H3L94_03605 [Neisseria shayeganii]
MLIFRRYGLCLAATLWLAGCFELEPMMRLSWKEEVELTDSAAAHGRLCVETKAACSLSACCRSVAHGRLEQQYRYVFHGRPR